MCRFALENTVDLTGWDISHPAAAQKLADLGVDIVFVPAYWLATDSEPYVAGAGAC